MDPIACILDRIAGVPSNDTERGYAMMDLIGWVQRGGFVPTVSALYAEANRRGLPIPHPATVRTLVRRGLLSKEG